MQRLAKRDRVSMQRRSSCTTRAHSYSVCLLVLAILASGCTGRPARVAKSVKKTPERIVSLTPSQTEILFAIGLGDKVVGDTAYCDYPPEAAGKPKVGDMNISTEKVVALKPDLVLAHSFLNRAEIEKLKSLGIEVLATDPKTLDETISDIQDIGRATGADEAAELVAKNMENAIAEIENQPHKSGSTSAIVVIQTVPLWVAGPQTFVDEMIARSHGKNIAYDAKAGEFSQFSSETALARNPDVIVVTRAEDKSFFEKSSIWRKANAVKNDRVVVIDPDLIVRPGPRLVDGLKQMSEALNN